MGKCKFFSNFIDKYVYKLYNKKGSHIAGWSSWQLVGLITQRSVVRVYLPQPNIASSKEFANFFTLKLFILLF